MEPRFLLSLIVTALKISTWLYAWLLVPVGLLVGGLRKGQPSMTQWAGLHYKGQEVTHVALPRIECRGPWRIFDLPDEPSIGQYEPTVWRVYNRFGWYVTVWYQLAFRNVGHGWPYLWSQWTPWWTLQAGHPLPPSETLGRWLGLYYGWRPYAAWRESPTALGHYDPLSQLSWYYVPWIGVSPDWAGAA